ncbi:amidohydrolase [Kitasatospora herbaricolor]|uniref:amidohydrolase family protein n=1 Tax=Kitasatospora herbaricolor TaxID=68217 RepID=UPI00174C5DBB|nr:amidohydrolase family protein [Kitasatospora herbaricolor]MDQ0305634.1 L-fuconolactonase [Kitasatospora herbaricolor]GGV45454.1 amidohydrolase [Kitasatospora herbaricolor]
MTRPGVIDAHHHLWDLAVRDQDWITGEALAPIRRDFSLADLRPLARRAGVTATVLVQTVCVAPETPEMLALAADDDLVAGVVGWSDLTDPGIADSIGRLRELPGGHKLVGLRHQVQSEPDPEWLLRPDVLRGLAAVADAGLAYDLLVLPHQLPAATEAATRLPALTLVLDHLAKPPVATGRTEPWATAIRALAARANTFCKLSGLVTEADWQRRRPADLSVYMDTALSAFGPERLMFGSDWPVCTLAATYGEVMDTARALTGGLSSAEQHAVFAGTAAAAYGPALQTH